MSLVVFTGLIGLLVAPGHLHPVLASPPCCASRVGAGRLARSTCGTTAISTR
jgi:protoheme IX farnesyltransferase